MILTFSKDRFVSAIKSGQKIHTIRKDRHGRWKPGMKIQLWRGNPRNPSKHPFCFGEKTCTRVERISIFRIRSTDVVMVLVNGIELSEKRIRQLAENDGLTVDQFRMWFVPPGNPVFHGKIIHWTNKKYSL